VFLFDGMAEKTGVTLFIFFKAQYKKRKLIFKRAEQYVKELINYLMLLSINNESF